jgi:general secretion pathway protein E
MLLGQLLVSAGKVSESQVDEALQAQDSAGPGHKRIGELLRGAGAVTELDILDALGRQYEVPVLRDGVPDKDLNPLLVQDLPVEWAREHLVLPFESGEGICALMNDPTRLEIIEDLAVLLGQDVQPVLATAEQITRATEKCYFQRTETAGDFLDTIVAEIATEPAAQGASDDLLRMADQAPVSQFVNLIMLDAVKRGASDIHIEPGEDRMRVRFRIDGVLYDEQSPPNSMVASLVSRLKVMGRLDIAEKRLPQDGMARVRVGELEIDVRVSTIPVSTGERVVLRLLNRESALYPLPDLGMPVQVLEPFQALLRQPNGIVLVTGPTGSGKTTTLYAALNELDTRRRNIMTIEDPVEYQLSDIGQIQVKPKIGLTFAHGLRHILRQDPDVILVGEIRDQETAEICVRSSMTGHLVFSTLHTNDAVSAVNRMIDMGTPSYLLAASLRACLAQRLLRRLCAACRKPVVLAESDVEGLGPAGQRLLGAEAWSAAGCPECLGGYDGRTGMYELMLITPEMRNSIRAGASQDELSRQAIEAGMLPLVEDGVQKILSGETTVEELQHAVGHL